MGLTAWIADYTAYLKAHGCASRTLSFRLKHLRSLKRFIAQQTMDSLEVFTPHHTSAFVAYWVHHQPWARSSPGG